MAQLEREDGRLARSRRSRLAVARALLELLEQGQRQPTARDIAERAGVSVRLVHHHFEDREALLIAASELQSQRSHRMLSPIDASQPFDDRLREFVRQRATLLEAISPVRRAALAGAPTSAVITDTLNAFRKLKREQVLQLFAAELAGFSAAARRHVGRAACTLASWSAWEEMRSHQGLSTAAARRALEQGLRALLLSGSGGTR